MKNDCLFCAIIDGEIPSKKVYEDEQCYAFYDIEPQAPVHFSGGAQGTHLLRQCHHGGQQRCGGPLLRGHRQDLQGAGRGELPNRQQLRRSGGTDREAPALPCAGGAGYDLASGLKENRKRVGESRPFFSVRRCGAGRGRFTPLCGYTLSTPCGGTCLPAGRSVRGSDRPPACHSTPRTPQVEGWGKIWGVLPVCGQLFCFSGMGADDLDKGVRI